MEVVYITHIGQMISGDCLNPILSADTLVVKDGLIDRIGDSDTLKPPAGADDY